MSFIETVQPEQATGDVAELYRRQQGAWGYVPNYSRVFCHRPEVMARWGQLLAEVRRPMDTRRFELVTFAVAHELRNSACTLAHGQKLRPFFADDDIVAMAAGRVPAALSEIDVAAMDFARQMARDASAVHISMVDRLIVLGLTDAEVFDIAAVAAARAFFTQLLDGLGVQPDSAFLALDVPLRHALTVGRPIDHRLTTAI
jgi:alkylhydroperoxidase family enzyme